MNDLNKEDIKDEVLKMIMLDKIDFPISICQNLKLEIVSVLKKYFNDVGDNVNLNIKVLPNSKYQIDIKCDTSFFILKR